MPSQRLVSGSHWKEAGTAHGGGSGTQKIKYSAATKVMWHVGGEAFENPFYSTDGGATWTSGGTAAAGGLCHDVSATRSGVYWGLFSNAAGFPVIGHSSNMTAWTTDFTDVLERECFNIAVSASGSLIAAVVHDTLYRLIVSEDSGATWDVRAITPLTTLSGGGQPQVQIVEGRIVLILQGEPVSDTPEVHYGVWGDADDLADPENFFITPGTLGFGANYTAFGGFGGNPPIASDLLVLSVYIDGNDLANGDPVVSSPNLTWETPVFLDHIVAPHTDQRMLVTWARVPVGFDFESEEITIFSGSTAGGLCFFSMCAVQGIDTGDPVVQIATKYQNLAQDNIDLTFAAFASPTNLGLVFHDMWNLYFANSVLFTTTAVSNWEDIHGTQGDMGDDWELENATHGMWGPFGAFHLGDDDLTVTFTKDVGTSVNQPWFAIGLELRTL